MSSTLIPVDRLPFPNDFRAVMTAGIGNIRFHCTQLDEERGEALAVDIAKGRSSSFIDDSLRHLGIMASRGARDKDGSTIDFLLRARRDTLAARRYFELSIVIMGCPRR